MKKLGIWLIIIGIGSFILPKFGLQFKILSIFGESYNIVAIACIIMGIFIKVLYARSSSNIENRKNYSGIKDNE